MLIQPEIPRTRIRILRSPDPRHSKDESAFREYLEDQLGGADADALVTVLWEHSATPVAYMGTLARFVKGVRDDGPASVMRVIELGRQPRDVRAAKMDLGVFVKLLLDENAKRMGVVQEADFTKAVDDAWLEIKERLTDRVRRMFPSASVEQVQEAVKKGCFWIPETRAFNIVAVNIIDALRESGLNPNT